MVLQKILVSMVPLMLLTVLPVAVADETYSSDYITFGAKEGATGHGLGFGLLMFPEGRDSCMCPTSSPDLEFGGVTLYPDDPSRDMVVHFDDAHFDGPGNSVCIVAQYSQEPCQRTGIVCGSHAVAGLPFDIWEAYVLTFTLYVTPELDACLGTTGTATVTFS